LRSPKNEWKRRVFRRGLRLIQLRNAEYVPSKRIAWMDADLNRCHLERW
jgi:hypothetical protein